MRRGRFHPTAFVLVLLPQPAAAITQSGPGLPPHNYLPGNPITINAISGAYSATGLVALSVDALGTLGSTGTIQVDKPAGGTVRAAFLAAASTGFTGYDIPIGLITINGTGVTWGSNIANSIASRNYFADVTAIVAPIVDAAGAGIVNLTIGEGGSSSLIDGTILAVVFDVPTLTRDFTVVIFFGAQNIAGDSFAIGLADPAQPLDPDYVLDLSLGISYGFQGTGQSSLIDVNGTRMTSSAGGQDDGTGAPGHRFGVRIEGGRTGAARGVRHPRPESSEPHAELSGGLAFHLLERRGFRGSQDRERNLLVRARGRRRDAPRQDGVGELKRGGAAPRHRRGHSRAAGCSR